MQCSAEMHVAQEHRDTFTISDLPMAHKKHLRTVKDLCSQTKIQKSLAGEHKHAYLASARYVGVMTVQIAIHRLMTVGRLLL